MKEIQQHIKTEVKDQVLNIIFNRPEKRNALNSTMINEIQKTLSFYKNKKDIKIVLFSSESTAFCAGADIKYLQKIKDFSFEENLKDSKKLMKLFKTILLYPKLIISKINGPAIAGGCGIATASDIIFATEESVFGYPEVRIGFIPALVSTFLTHKINGTQSRELLLTGGIITAKKAIDIGLINYMHKTSEIDKKVDDFIKEVLKNTSMESIAETKKMIYLWLGLENKLKKSAELNAKSRKTKNFKKGVSAFLKKTKIDWRKQ
jgi:methylglutaconyl-CoA hydratase